MRARKGESDEKIDAAISAASEYLEVALAGFLIVTAMNLWACAFVSS
jgi:hypothetical protein